MVYCLLYFDDGSARSSKGLGLGYFQGLEIWVYGNPSLIQERNALRIERV
jgi:hypothetical protein